MNQSEMTSSDLEAISAFLESPAFGIIVSRASSREDYNIRRLLKGGADEGDDIIRGRIREMSDFMRWLSECDAELKERLKNNSATDVDDPEDRRYTGDKINE